MNATRLSPVWQVAGIAAAALCCYLVSQWVASERAALAKVDRQIAAEQDGITKLTTEIATRSRFTQIEGWNRQLALQAPRPGQYMASGFQLASLYARDPRPALPLDPAVAAHPGPVQEVAYHPAPAAAPAPVAAPSRSPAAAPTPRRPVPETAPPAPEPLLRTATFVRPKPSRLGDPAPAVERVGYRPAAPLLSADIATLARDEQARRKPAGEGK